MTYEMYGIRKAGHLIDEEGSWRLLGAPPDLNINRYYGCMIR